MPAPVGDPWRRQMARTEHVATFEPVIGASAAAAPHRRRRFPPGFDPAPFAEQAKLQFRRLQAAYDAADRKALADVMTPEMFARSQARSQQRGAQVPTEVIALDAEVLEVDHRRRSPLGQRPVQGTAARGRHA